MPNPMKSLLPLAAGLALGAWAGRRARPQPPAEDPARQAQLQQQIEAAQSSGSTTDPALQAGEEEARRNLEQAQSQLDSYLGTGSAQNG